MAAALAGLIVMWAGIPRLTPWLEGRLQRISGVQVRSISFKPVITSLFQFDPARPGPRTNLFYPKILVVDVVDCSIVIVKLSVVLLAFLGITVPDA